MNSPADPSPHDEPNLKSVSGEEGFAEILAELDEAIAAGDSAHIDRLCAANPQLADRLKGDQLCVELLQQLRPAPPPANQSTAVAGHEDTEDPRKPERLTAARLPRRFGRFEVLKQLGQGGFGIVFLAKDEQLRREIALKVPRFEALLPDDLKARFQREARAGAGLDHANIAAVYEAGEIAGIGYIASAYCPGQTLAEWLAELDHPVPAQAAAELVAVLADAIDHAHGRGVLHRDLKPANVILVQASGPEDLQSIEKGSDSASCLLQGCRYIPKITDFGLAKNLADDQDPRITRTGAFFGTPSYMAPEQAADSPAASAPTTDIYGLGSILYEVLTGEPPFVGSSPFETVEKIKNEEPVPPRQHQRSIPTDLQTICLKCLEKDPLKRYPSGRALLEDLSRFLDHRPILARRVKAHQRMWRWCLRQPVVASLLATLVLVTAVGFSVVFSLWRQSEHNRITAVANLSDANQNLSLARGVVNQYVLDVQDDLRLSGEDLRPLRRRLLELAVPFFESVVARYEDSDDVLREQAEAYMQLASISEELGDLDRAEQMFDAAVIAFETLASGEPDTAELKFRLCQARQACGLLQQRRGQYTEAEELYGQVLGPLESLRADFPEEAEYREALALLHHQWGTMLMQAFKHPVARDRLEHATSLYSNLLQASPDDDYLRFLSNASYNSLGMVYLNLEQPQQAAQQFTTCLENLVPLLAKQPSNPQFIGQYVRVAGNLGIALSHSRVGNHADAESQFQAAAEAADKLASDHPSVARFRQMQLDASGNYGELLSKAGQLERAEIELRRATELGQYFLAQHQEFPEVRLRMIRTDKLLAELLVKTGREEEAEPLLLTLIDRLRDLLAAEPKRVFNHFEYDGVVYSVVQLLRGRGALQSGIALLEQEEAHITELAEKHPDVSSFGFVLTHLREQQANIKKELEGK